MTRPSSLGRFALAAIGWYIVLAVAWMVVVPWGAQPAATLAHIVLGNAANDWVRTAHTAPGRIEVDTRAVVRAGVAVADANVSNINAPGATQTPAGHRGELVAEVATAKYAYGVPLLAALLLAAGTPHALWRFVLGYVLLWPAIAFGIALDVLKQIIVNAAEPVALGINALNANLIALGYQFGYLLLPALAPVALWLWFDGEYVRGLPARRRAMA